jgi:hypothetical protein
MRKNPNYAVNYEFKELNLIISEIFKTDFK